MDIAERLINNFADEFRLDIDMQILRSLMLFSATRKGATIEDIKTAIKVYPDLIANIPQTPEICLYAMKHGLDNSGLISIEWTPEMKTEWVLRHV